MAADDETGRLRIGVLSMPVNRDLDANWRALRRGLHKAARANVNVLVTPECALTGYAGWDLESHRDYDWKGVRALHSALTVELRSLRQKGHVLWLAVGAAHFVADDLPPTNALYLYGPSGELVDRYDKRMLTPTDERDFLAGDRPVVVDIDGVRFGLLICHDGCYPEMYADLRARGVDAVLHAFHNAGFREPNILGEMGPAWVRVRAADNGLWVFAANASHRQSAWGSRIARPDGSFAKTAARNREQLSWWALPDPELPGWLHNHKPMRVAPDEVLTQGPGVDHPRIADGRAKP